jgi:hypothetical protein
MHRVLLLALGLSIALCFSGLITGCESDSGNDTTVVVTNAAAGDNGDADADADDADAEVSTTNGSGSLDPGESDSTAIAVSEDGAVALAAASDNGPLAVKLIRNGDVVGSDEDIDVNLSGHATAGDTWTVEVKNNVAVPSDFSWTFTVTPD